MRFLISLIVGFAPMLGGLAVSTGSWYTQLAKPSFNPPAWVFGPVWTLLYISLGLSWHCYRTSPTATTAGTGLFLAHLLLNALWSPLFFGLHLPSLALADLLLMDLSLLVLLRLWWPVSPLAAGLLLPYAAWITFATVLNAAIVKLNA